MIGKTLGHYQITSQIGKGGMGEVYLADDLSLDRKAALKFLPEIFTGDPERLARFEREAKVLASLNHPNIAAIYGLEQAEGKRFLVLELVEGETLAQRISKGSLPIEEALEICRQIAEALEAAHERGVIHRDLKPANVMITAGDKVKILDFGLAKALSDEWQNADSSQSPTLTEVMTRPGVILGTAAYMSPEQAKGKAVDKRADIWAFGCILYECLTGKRAFEGEAVTETLAGILKGEPDWQALPETTPSGIRVLLRRCLQKDATRRFRDIRDVRIELEEPSSLFAEVGPGTKAARPAWKVVVLLSVAAILGAAISAAWLLHLQPSAPAKVARFSFVLPEGQSFTNMGRHVVAISPDGASLAYVANGQIYLRRLSETESRPISGTQDTGGVTSPFFSPDGQWIGFCSVTEGALKKIAVTGGAAITLCKAGNPYGVSWYQDTILAGQGLSGILVVSANGGTPGVLFKPEAGEIADSPQMLPGGDAVLYAALKRADSASGTDRWDKADIVVYSRKTGKKTVLVRGGSAPRYVSTGHIVYALGTNLLAIPFNLKRLEVRGGPTPVVEGVMRAQGLNTGIANFAFSDDGTLVCIPSRSMSSADAGQQVLVLVDRSGSKRDVLGLPPGSYSYPRLSPDGKQLAVVTNDDGGTIWIYDLSGKSALRRLTLEGSSSFPVWSPDGKQLAFSSNRDNKPGIFVQAADGSTAAERLTGLPSAERYIPNSWSPDGKTLAFTALMNDYSIWILPLEGERKAQEFMNLPSSVEAHASFSPDGRWVAYMSGASTFNVYVQPFPKTGAARYQISRDGRYDVPVWSPDGKELFFWEYNAERLVAVPIQTQPSLYFGQPVPLPIEGITHPQGGRAYDIMRDGKRFLVMLPETQTRQQPRPVQQVNVVLNWFEELKQRVPVK